MEHTIREKCVKRITKVNKTCSTTYLAPPNWICPCLDPAESIADCFGFDTVFRLKNLVWMVWCQPTKTADREMNGGESGGRYLFANYGVRE